MKANYCLSQAVLALLLAATVHCLNSRPAWAADTTLDDLHLAKAAPVITRLENALASKDKFGAEDILEELEKLIPADARMARLRARVAAAPGPKKTLTIDLGGGVNMDLVLIRPGSFVMGSDEGSSYERPAHKVTLTRPFYLGKHEVSQEQWQAVMGSNPSYFKGPKLPVETVSWNDCQDFLKKLAVKIPGREFALPTEAQWEYACRAGATTKYSFGDSEASLADYAWYSGNSGGATHPVGEKKPNAWGLYDMQGNVWEWCADWFTVPSSDGEAADPHGRASGTARVKRGGSWIIDTDFLRCGCRACSSPGTRINYCGFRVAGVVGSSSP